MVCRKNIDECTGCHSVLSQQAEKAKPKAIAHPIDTKAADALSKKQQKKKRERELAAQERAAAHKAQVSAQPATVVAVELY